MISPSLSLRAIPFSFMLSWLSYFVGWDFSVRAMLGFSQLGQKCLWKAFSREILKEDCVYIPSPGVFRTLPQLVLLATFKQTGRFSLLYEWLFLLLGPIRTLRENSLLCSWVWESSPSRLGKSEASRSQPQPWEASLCGSGSRREI